MLDGAGTDLFTSLRQDVQDDYDALVEWREQARVWYEFASGHQWTAAELRALEQAHRTPITINRIGATIRHVVGQEIGNRREVRYKPRTLEDAGVTEVLTAAAEYFRDRAGAERMESVALQDCLTCGLGWVEDRVETIDDPAGELVFERVDPFEMGFDCRANESNLIDARRIWRAKSVDRLEAVEMFPDVDESQLDARWYGRGRDDDDSGFYSTSDDDTRKSKTVTIVEVQYWLRERMVELYTPAGVTTLRLDQFNEIADRLPPGIQTNVVTKKIYYQAFLGAGLIDHAVSANQDGFTWKCMTGYRDRKEHYWYGIVKDMIDPQKYHNRFLTTSLHIMQTNAKGGVMMAREATDKPQEFEEDWAAAGSVVTIDRMYTASGAPNVVPKPQTALPQEIPLLLGETNRAFDLVTGMNSESRGQAETIQPAALAAMRRQTSMISMLDIMDGYRSFRMLQGKSIAQNISKYLADGRLVRLVGQGREQFVQLAGLPDQLEFDVVIDDSPTSPNEKERMWPIVMEMMKMFPPNPQMLPEILEYSPLGVELVEKLRRMLSESRPPPELMAQEQQLKMLMRQIAVEQAKAELMETQAKTARLGAQAQLDATRAQEIAATAGAEMVLDQARAAERQAEAGLDMARAQALGAYANADEQFARAFEAQQRARAATAQANAVDARGQIDIAQRINRLRAEAFQQAFDT